MEKNTKNLKTINVLKPIGIKPGETVVVKVSNRLGEEPEEIKRVLNTIQEVNGLKEEYKDFDKDVLMTEYRRIYTDFELFLRHEHNMQAILGVLVDEHGLTQEEIAKLREEPK